MPRDVASRAAKEACDLGFGVGASQMSVYLDFKGSIDRLGESAIEQKYGNLFAMYDKITGDNPYKTPMRIYPAVHYVMGGLWVDYDLMTTIPGLFALGECNFSDHGANRLGASALMQGLADGYFIIPTTIGNYLANVGTDKPNVESANFKEAATQVEDRIKKLTSMNDGKKTVDEIHKELGKTMWDYCGMDRNKEGLTKCISKIEELRNDFWKNLKIPKNANTLNQSLEKAGRVSDLLELGELMSRDALNRNESCGGHFRSEYQTEDHEAQRNDNDYCYVAAWECKSSVYDTNPKHELHKEELKFDNVKLTSRSYK